jgi:hypothetical protein
VSLQDFIPSSIRKQLNRFVGQLPTPTTSDERLKHHFDKLPRGLKAYRNDLFHETGPVLWLDQENYKERVDEKVKKGALSTEDAEVCTSFADNGFVIIKNLISEKECDLAWEAFLRDWKLNKFKLDEEPKEFNPHWGRVGNIHHYVKEMHQLLHHKEITRVMDFLLDDKCIPYQTIPSFYGSEQKSHSDAIHMTTFPLGFMTAAWIALEDVHPDSGPLHYYPGSHRLPYILSKEVGIKLYESHNKGREVYLEKYEPKIERFIVDNHLNPSFFVPEKGDVLIWHHNLIHGGSPVKDSAKSRKSLVCHYFSNGTFAYHDLTNTHADVEFNGTYKGQ